MLTSTLIFAPLDEPVKIPIQNKQLVQKEQKQPSECNTLVMIFIGSVLVLALLDSMK